MRAAKIVTASALFLALTVQLGVRVEVTKKAYLMEHLRAEALENDVLLRDLKLNYAWLTSPEQLGKRASIHLGLQAPKMNAVKNISR
jgi:hypothetical protein